jgi:hypothetical protein
MQILMHLNTSERARPNFYDYILLLRNKLNCIIIVNIVTVLTAVVSVQGNIRTHEY